MRRISPWRAYYCNDNSALRQFGVWRSLVAHLVWDQGVVGSNPTAPTIGDLIRSGADMVAKIYCPAKIAMQSGQGKSDTWVIEFERTAPRTIDPLMGYTSSTNMMSQVRLKFGTKEEAIAYADRNGLAYRISEPRQRKRRPVAYSDNFAYSRRQSWTH